MKAVPTPIPDCYVLEPVVYEDSRGFFFESYNRRAFAEATGHDLEFVQDNHSKSSYGVVRGLHYQRPPHQQCKLIRVLSGVILDVVVDLRRDSPARGQVFQCELSAANRRQLFVPRGLAHGFAVLSPEAEVAYKCDAYYQPGAEAGIRFDDPALAIDWKIPGERMILSEKDQQHPSLADADAFG